MKRKAAQFTKLLTCSEEHYITTAFWSILYMKTAKEYIDILYATFGIHLNGWQDFYYLSCWILNTIQQSKFVKSSMLNLENTHILPITMKIISSVSISNVICI